MQVVILFYLILGRERMVELTGFEPVFVEVRVLPP